MALRSRTRGKNISTTSTTSKISRRCSTLSSCSKRRALCSSGDSRAEVRKLFGGIMNKSKLMSHMERIALALALIVSACALHSPQVFAQTPAPAAGGAAAGGAAAGGAAPAGGASEDDQYFR